MLDGGGGNIRQIGRHRQITHHHLGRTGFDEPARGRGGGLSDRAFQLRQTHVVGLQQVGIGLHFDLTDAAAHVEDLRDAGDALEATSDGPISEGAHFGGRHVVRILVSDG